MIWLDTKYINLVAFHLKGFVQKRTNLWNSRCPFCGDSEKNESLKRFYIYERGQGHFCKCHNCGYWEPFSTFLEAIDPPLFKEYTYERVTERYNGRTHDRASYKQSATRLPTVSDDFLSDLPRISDLPEDHSAYAYCKDRKLPQWVMADFRWANDFKEVASKMNAVSAESLRENDPRIVIPFYDEDKDVSVIQGRTTNPNVKPKYISIKMNDSVDKVFGMDRVDKRKPIIVMEGPIDSVFVDNAVATGDSDLTRVKKADAYVFDNQPRNREIVKKVKRAVDSGLPVFFWPHFLGTGKDINDMVKDGLVKPEELHDLIMKNTCSGLEAMMAFAAWSKVV